MKRAFARSIRRRLVCSSWSRPVAWFTGSLTALTAVAWAAEAPAAEGEEAAEKQEGGEAAAETDLRNWFSVSAGGAMVNGNDAAFQRRHQVPATAFGGVDGFHYEQAFRKDGTFKVDGRGIFDNHDYELKFELTDPAVGFVRGGYREHRQWYDGSGGYLPSTGAWLELYADDLAVDSGEAWIEAGLTLPKAPKLTFGYRYAFREGEKDSTSWGLSTQAGQVRGIAPGFWGLDEQRHLITADLEHRMGKTLFGLGVSYEFGELDNTRNLRQYPGEANDARVTQRDTTDLDLFNVHAHSETRLSEKALFTVGYAFTDLDNDFLGYRVYGAGYDADLAQRLPSPNSFSNLMGGSRMSQHLANVNLMYRLSDSVVFVPTVRIESQDRSGLTGYDLPAPPLSPNAYTAESERGLLDVAGGLELRYTGITNVVLYTQAYWMQGSGDLTESWDNVANRATVLDRTTDDERSEQKYTLGSTWYPLRRLHFGAEYYHKIRDNDFTHLEDSTGNLPPSLSRYPAFLRAQRYDVDDVNARVTWRPRNNVTLVGRYDYQFTRLQNTADGLVEVDSGEIQSEIFSGSASWTPFSRLYLQGIIGYVLDTTDTPADEITSAVQRGENDYWTATFTAGFALDDKTDLEAQYLYYRADNYSDNSANGVPYGAGLTEHGVTAGITHRLNARVRLSLRYGFFTSEDETSGYYNDYDAHMVYGSMQYRF